MSHRIRRRRVALRLERLDERCLPAILWPNMVPWVYGIDPAIANGAGQTIAIIDAYHHPYLKAELDTFDQTLNLPPVSLKQVTLGSGIADPGWNMEETLDVEWAHVVAPAANLIVYEATSATNEGLIAAVTAARSNPAVSVITMSWGSPEYYGQTYNDAYMTTPAGHIPITFLASSGDYSAYAGVSWPSISPNVISVGGTSFSLNPQATAYTETGWAGSGGGYSQIYPEPSYQRPAQSTGIRTNPDVSIDADPSSGELIYSISPFTAVGSWDAVGGTSASVQLWGGLIADINQLRVAGGKTTLSTSTALTVLYQNPWVFRDVTSGFNGYSAGPGYDLVTGLGSVNNANNIWTVLWYAANSTGGGPLYPPSGGGSTVISSMIATNGLGPVTPVDLPTTAVAPAVAQAPTVMDVAFSASVLPASTAAAAGSPSPSPAVAPPALPAAAPILFNAVPQAILAAPAGPSRPSPLTRPAAKAEPDAPAESTPETPRPPSAIEEKASMPAGQDPAPAEAAPESPAPAPPARGGRQEEGRTSGLIDPVAAAIAGWPAGVAAASVEGDAEAAPASTAEAALPSLGAAALVTFVAFDWGKRPRLRAAIGRRAARAVRETVG